MEKQEGKYNIKAASKILGIQPGTLRAWERRYHMVAPVRNESGHRLYTEEHIKILKWLINKVNQGFTISQAVSLLENDQIASEIVLQDGTRIDEYTDELLEALLKFDEIRTHDLINTCFSLYTIEKVVIKILGPILVKIGDLWEAGKITSAHEHFASSIIRSRIGMILHNLPHNTLLPKAVAVCAPGEGHEFGLLIFTLFLRHRGFEVIYLGASIAEEDINEVIRIAKPKFLFFSCTMKDRINSLLPLVDELSASFDQLEIGLGGSAIDALEGRDKENYHTYIIGSSHEEWEKWIKERIGLNRQFTNPER